MSIRRELASHLETKITANTLDILVDLMNTHSCGAISAAQTRPDVKALAAYVWHRDPARIKRAPGIPQDKYNCLVNFMGDIVKSRKSILNKLRLPMVRVNKYFNKVNNKSHEALKRELVSEGLYVAETTGFYTYHASSMDEEDTYEYNWDEYYFPDDDFFKKSTTVVEERSLFVANMVVEGNDNGHTLELLKKLGKKYCQESILSIEPSRKGLPTEGSVVYTIGANRGDSFDVGRLHTGQSLHKSIEAWTSINSEIFTFTNNFTLQLMQPTNVQLKKFREINKTRRM